ncbi:MAG: S-formylglutathione hydrolase [Rudaea sp.]
MSELETVAEHRCFGGVQGFYRHESAACAGPMRFAVYRPPQAERSNVPVLYFLSGLACTEENFMIKAGAQRLASELGLMVVVPDTSPRNTGISGEADSIYFGAGAGLYLNATQAPWSRVFQMYTYIVQELPRIVADNFPSDVSRESIFGHSMGGHGALTIALKNPQRFKSVSAFAPICAPMRTDWTQQAFARFLGDDRESWKEYDATELVARQHLPFPILIDQGTRDESLPHLHPQIFEDACRHVGQPLTLRMHDDYDHNYFFISSFIEDHMRHHAAALNGRPKFTR